MTARIDILLQHPGVAAFGQAILHSLWQGTLVVLCLFVILRFVKNNSNLRYLLACGALLCLLLAFGYTFYLSYTPPVQVSSNGSVPEFTTSVYTIFEVNILQSANVYEEKTFSFATYYAAISEWVGRYTHYIFTLWLLGFLVFSTRLCLGLYYAGKLKRNGQQPEEVWMQKLEQYRRTLGIKSPVQLLTSAQVHTPLTLGWIRPVILLPVGMLTQWPYEHLESILLHELAHIRRQDYLINLLQSVAETLLFFNPAYWYITRIIERERENACDDMAVRIMQKPMNYARALTQVAELTKADWVVSATTVAANKGSLTERIRRIVLASAGHTIQRSEKTKWYLMSIIAIAVLAAVMIAEEVKGHQSEKNVEIEVDADPGVDIEEEVDVDLEVDIEEEANVDLEIDIEEDIDLDVELDVDAMGVHIDSTSLYHFLYSQWEHIKKRKIAMGEEVPENYLLSDKILYIVDGEARDPKTIQPPFEYTMKVPLTVMWAAMELFGYPKIEDSYAAFRKKYPGDYNNVVLLTSKASKSEINPDEPFTVNGQVFNSRDTPLSGVKVQLKGENISTFTDADGRFKIRVPHSKTTLIFSNPYIYPSVTEWIVDDRYRDKKLIVSWRERKNPLVKMPAVKIQRAEDNSGEINAALTEKINSSDTGVYKAKASAIQIMIDDKNRKDLPVYFVDGVEVTPEFLTKLNSEDLREIEVIKNPTAMERYGEKGKNGVVLITSKKAVQEGRVQISSISNSGNPIFIVDGKPFDDTQLSLLDPKEIASVEVLKGEEAKKKYGEEAANGVVIINTKSKKYGKEDLVDKGPSFDETMEKATEGMLDTMTLDEIYNYHLTLDQGLNRLQSSINQYAKEKEMDKPVSTLDFSEDNVLYLLDGVKTDPQSINYYDIASLEVIRANAEQSYQKNMKGFGYLGQKFVYKKIKDYTQNYPGDYDAVVVATSKNKNLGMVPNEETNYLTVFPNPSENIFTIRLTLAEDAPVQVSVTNAAGRLVTSLTDRSLGKGTLELTWDASGQKPGLYRIRIIQNGETTYRNVLVK